MTDGQPKAISLQGMVHNATKIGVQDGQTEDLVNLRFKDGAWRTSGDGKHVFSITDTHSGHTYEQLYIHTNIYRHLLGVERDKDAEGKPLDTGTLYWIANLTPKEDAASIDDEDFVFKAITPVELTKVTGDLTITQTGHLITVIDEADDFEFFVYKTSENKYIEGKVDSNGNPYDRTLFPFGNIHVNWHSEYNEDYVLRTKAWLPASESESGEIEYLPYDYTIKTVADMQDKNKFVNPVIVVVALELYDGSYAYACSPILINPGEDIISNRSKRIVFPRGNTDPKGEYDFDGTARCFVDPLAVNQWLSDDEANPIDTDSVAHLIKSKYKRANGIVTTSNNITIQTSSNSDGTNKQATLDQSYIALEGFPPIMAVESLITTSGYTEYMKTQNAFVRGYDLVVSIENEDIINSNSEIFTAVCVFVSREIPFYETDPKKYEVDDRSFNGCRWTHTLHGDSGDYSEYYTDIAYWSHIPKFVGAEKFRYEVANSQFFLLKRYNENDIHKLIGGKIVDLSGVQDQGLLKSINQGTVTEVLQTESLSRYTYLPKYSYLYNGRIHMANYKTNQFHGYPIDSFCYNNHSVKPSLDGKAFGFLKGLEAVSDSGVQFARDIIPIYEDEQLKAEGTPVVIAKVFIKTQDGTQEVVRYIRSGDNTPVDKLEDLDPFITFPDLRATKIEIYYVIKKGLITYLCKKELPLTPHPYLNIAYYFKSDLKPIKWSDFTVIGILNDVEFIPSQDDAVLDDYDISGNRIPKL